MKFLYILALLSFTALAGAAFAIMRHVRKGSRHSSQSAIPTDEMDAMVQRLQQVVRPPAEDRSAPGPGNGQRDFAYFNRDPAEKPERELSDIPYPETTERTRKNATDHL